MPELKPTIDEAISSALKLKELDKSIIKVLGEGDLDLFIKSIEMFVSNKKIIKIYFSQNPITNIPDIRDKHARDILQQVSSGIPFTVEKAFKGEVFEDVFSVVLSEEEKEELAEDMFHSWFSHLDYVDAMLEIGSLVLSVGKIPDHLMHFVDEMRQCYVFQQYAAAYALCRTILEISVRDLCLRFGIIKKDTAKVKHLNVYNFELAWGINQLCNERKFKRFRSRLNDIKRKTNASIHGNKVVRGEMASNMLRKTLKVIHELYE